MSRWSMTLGLALAGLLKNRAHSALTALGIVVGVAALVTVTHAARSASARVLADVSGLISANGFVVNPEPVIAGEREVPLTTEDAEAIASGIAPGSVVASYVDTDATIVREARHFLTRVAGVTLGYFSIRRFDVRAGALWSRSDESSKASVCVLGHRPAEILFPGGDPVGRTVRIAGAAFQVVAVLASRGTSAVTDDQDDRVMVPLETYRAHIETSEVGEVEAILIGAVSVDAVPRSARRVEAILRERHRSVPPEAPNFRITTQRELTRTQESIAQALEALLIGVAAISLLSGGTGIMNTMLGSVAERTYEIGVRLSIGARARDVLAQFLTEAMLLAGAGGACGAALGIAGALLVARALAVPFAVDWITVVWAMGVSMGVGLAFGLLPALRAARLDPVHALRAR